MSLSKANQKLKFDTRMKDWFHKNHQFNEKEWESYFKSLEDVQPNVATISLKDGMEGTKEKAHSYEADEVHGANGSQPENENEG